MSSDGNVIFIGDRMLDTHLDESLLEHILVFNLSLEVRKMRHSNGAFVSSHIGNSWLWSEK